MTADRLAQMLATQRQLQDELDVKLRVMTGAETIDYIKTMFIAAVKELGEALDEVQWKPWAKQTREINTQGVSSELIDTLQFIMNIWFAIYPAASSEQLAELIFTSHASKIAINRKRIREGYDGRSTKCVKCHRAMDDSHVKCTYEWCEIYGPSVT